MMDKPFEDVFSELFGAKKGAQKPHEGMTTQELIQNMEHNISIKEGRK